MTPHWRRTQSLDHHGMTVHADDWTLVNEGGEHIARIFDLGDADLLGSWRWWVWPFHEIDNIGSAQTGAEAKQLVEERFERLVSEDNPR